MEPWHPQKVHGQWWSQCLTHATVLIQFLISPLRSWNSSWDLPSFVSPEHSLQQTPGNQVLHWQILLQQGLQEPCTRCLRARSSIFLLKCRCHLTVFQGHSYLNANGKPSQTQIRTIAWYCLEMVAWYCVMFLATPQKICCSLAMVETGFSSDQESIARALRPWTLTRHILQAVQEDLGSAQNVVLLSGGVGGDNSYASRTCTSKLHSEDLLLLNRGEVLRGCLLFKNYWWLEENVLSLWSHSPMHHIHRRHLLQLSSLLSQRKSYLRARSHTLKQWAPCRSSSNQSSNKMMRPCYNEN